MMGRLRLLLLACSTLGCPAALLSAPRTDALGDPLPPAAKARIGTSRLYAGGAVTSLAFSADGKVLFSLASPGPLLAWDSSSGKELTPLKDVPVSVSTMTLSPTGRLLAAATPDGTVRVWDVLSGRLLRTHKVEEKAAPRDGKAVPGAALPPPVPMKGVRPGRPVPPGVDPLDDGTGASIALAFSHDNKTLAIASLEGLHLYDLEAGKVASTLKGLPGATWLTFSADGKLLAGVGPDGHALVWDRASGKRLRRYDLDPEPAEGAPPTDEGALPILRVDFTPDSKGLVACASDGSLRWLDMDSIEELKKTPLVEGGDMSSFGLSPDGKLAAVSSSDGVVKVVEVSTGKELHSIEADQGPASCCALAPGGKVLATGDATGQLRLWDVATGKERALPGKREGLLTAGFSADGKKVVVVTPAGLRHHASDSGKELSKVAASLPNPGGPAGGNATALELSPGARLLAVLFEEGGLKLIDTATGKEKHELKWEGKEGPVMFTFSPDGRLLAGVSQRQSALVRFWDTRTGKEGPALGDTEGAAGHLALAFSPDGRVLFTGHPREGQLRRWELATGKERLPFRLPAEVRNPDVERELRMRKALRLRGAGIGIVNEDMQAQPLNNLTIAPDGRVLAIPHGNVVLVCAVASGRVLRRLGGEREEQTIDAVCFSPDSKFLAVAEEEGVVRLYDVASGGVRGVLRGHRGAVTQLAFSPSGKEMLSVSSDGSCLIWDVSEVLRRGPEDPLAGKGKTPDDLWADLGSDDGAKAEEAVRALQGLPKEALELFEAHLKPAAALPKDRLEKLIADLDNEDFEVREEASTQLEVLGELAGSALREAAKKRGSKDRDRRLKELLERLERPGLTGELARQVRAVEVLEGMGTPAARAVLASLSRGASDSRLTKEARAALERLGGS